MYERPDARFYQCAHGHTWAMLVGAAKRCPDCGTITFDELRGAVQ